MTLKSRAQTVDLGSIDLELILAAQEDARSGVWG